MSQNQRRHRAHGMRRAIAFLPLLLLTGLGCAQIIGLDDYTVASGGATSGKSGAGGQSGTAGHSGNGSGNANAGGEAGAVTAGGAGGAGGDAGNASGGDAGSGNAGSGNAGSGNAGSGNAGSDGLGTTTLGCDDKTSFNVNQDVVRSCILRAGCNPFVPVRSISECVTNNTQQAYAGERCNLNSTTCADYEACDHVGIASASLCPTSRQGTDYCSGNKAVSCDSDPSLYSHWVDCTANGGTCTTYPNPDTSAGAHPFIADCLLAGESCTGLSDQTLTCSDEAQPVYQYYCVDGDAYGGKCGDSAYCGLDASDDATCFLTAATCGADSTTCTAKNVAKVCSNGGEYDFDCGSVGLTCGTGAPNDAGRTNYCLAPGCKPADVTSCSESCNGTKLDFCYGGAQVEVDCTDYGFTGCLDGLTNNDKLTNYATCAN